ncbi:MAG: AI-2E family transporter [Sedimentisphaerales bacterium]|nr:AI-2E family transporter [Sedimentisphaerales bacterium]
MDRSDNHSEVTWLIVGSLTFLAVVALGFVLLYTRGVLIPFVLAVFIVSLVSPILDYQVLRLHIPRAIAAALTFLFVIVMIVILVLVITQAVQNILNTAETYSESIASLTGRALDQLASWGLDLRNQDIISEIRKGIPQFATNTIGTAFGFFSSALFVLIFILFLLIGRNPQVIRNGVYADIDLQIRRYIGIKLAASFITALLVYAALAAIQLKLATFFAVLAFFLNFIPSIGSIVSTLLPIPIAAAQYEAMSLWAVLYVVLVPGVIQMTIGNIIEPRFQGRELHLHPITVLMALLFWGLLWGIPGMFLAIPMTAVIRIVLMQFDSFHFIVDLLAGKLPEPRQSITNAS